MIKFLWLIHEKHANTNIQSVSILLVVGKEGTLETYLTQFEKINTMTSFCPALLLVELSHSKPTKCWVLLGPKLSLKYCIEFNSIYHIINDVENWERNICLIEIGEKERIAWLKRKRASYFLYVIIECVPLSVLL